MAVEIPGVCVEPEKLINAAGLAEILALGHSKIYQMLSAGLLPPSISFGRARRWRPKIIQAWLELGCPSAEGFLMLTRDDR